MGRGKKYKVFMNRSTAKWQIEQLIKLYDEEEISNEKLELILKILVSKPGEYYKITEERTKDLNPYIPYGLRLVVYPEGEKEEIS